MKITVRFFAMSRELTGIDQIELEIKDTATVKDVIHVMWEKYPKLEKLKNSLRYAVDDEYADDEYELHPGQELCFIPPVSGG